MAADISWLLDHSLSKSIQSTYTSGNLSLFPGPVWRCHWSLPWQLAGSGSTLRTSTSSSREQLIAFVTFCQESLGLRFDTIKLYLAGIRFFYIKRNNVDILKDNLQLPYILRGIKKSQCNLLKGLRLPITFPVLCHMCNVVRQGLFSPFVDCMLLAIYVNAFYRFLRCGEFTVNATSASYLRFADVSFDRLICQNSICSSALPRLTPLSKLLRC